MSSRLIHVFYFLREFVGALHRSCVPDPHTPVKGLRPLTIPFLIGVVSGVVSRGHRLCGNSWAYVSG
jgi:hypothetical protein